MLSQIISIKNRRKINMLYFEDFKKGKIFNLGPKLISSKEIIEFGKLWDPQYFHINEKEAEKSVYKNLIASGYHTCCFVMRMMVDEVLSNSCSLGSPGVNAIKWPSPVYANSNIKVILKVKSKRLSKSNDKRGLIEWETSAYDQNNNLVLYQLSIGLFGKKNT